LGKAYTYLRVFFIFTVMMSHDARDTNNDGKVSLMEKVKDKLHLHHKDKDTNTTTGHSTALPTSSTSHSGAADLNHDGRISTGEKLASSGLGAGSGLAAGSALGSHSSGLNSNGIDLNHDGRISAGEKLAGAGLAAGGLGSSGLHSGGVGSNGIDLNHDGRISTGEKLAGAGLAAGTGLAAGSALGSNKFQSSEYNSSTGFHDSRDLNRDGHISTGERLAANSTGLHSSGISSSGYQDSRDLNRDGHISTSERLAATSGLAGSRGYQDSRDLNGDGHVSIAERLETRAGAGLLDEATRIRLHEEQLAVSKREALAGEVDIHKRVHQEHVQETVAVKHEEILIERRPLSGIAEPGARIAAQDEVVRVPLFREEIVTEKRIVPTEEVIVRKKEIVENQTVGATLRSEFVETRQTGAFDARDRNFDGHVSMGERLEGDLTHNKTGAYTNTSGALDARDTNRDGHVSMGEKLKSADMRDSAFDARDRNLDGRVSAGEKLVDAAGMNPVTKAARG